MAAAEPADGPEVVAATERLLARLAVLAAAGDERGMVALAESLAGEPVVLWSAVVLLAQRNAVLARRGVKAGEPWRRFHT